MRVPPPPNGISRTFEREMYFSIRGIDNDVSRIKSVIVTSKNKNLLEQYSPSIQDFNFSVQVNLEYGKKTEIDIQVVLKNGKILNATKTYEVR